MQPCRSGYNGSDSAVFKHIMSTGHQIDVNNVPILVREKPSFDVDHKKLCFVKNKKTFFKLQRLDKKYAFTILGSRFKYAKQFFVCKKNSRTKKSTETQRQPVATTTTEKLINNISRNVRLSYVLDVLMTKYLIVKTTHIYIYT